MKKIKLFDKGLMKQKEQYTRHEVEVIGKYWTYAVFTSFILGIVAGVALATDVVQLTVPLNEAEAAEEVAPEQVEQLGSVAKKDDQAVKVKAEVKACGYCHISDWVAGKVAGSPIDVNYVDALYRASGEDVYLTELAVAIAFAETTLGTHPAVVQQTNFMGYDAPNGYDPSDLNEFAGRLMRGLEYYRGVENNRGLATIYTGADRVDTWLGAVNEALIEMEAVK